MEKILDGVRYVLKNDTEENWRKAVNFIPKKGEPIIYNKDSNHTYSRIKIGDGSTKVNDLPFTDIDNVAKLNEDNIFTEKNTFNKGLKVSSEQILQIGEATIEYPETYVQINTKGPLSINTTSTIVNDIDVHNAKIAKVGNPVEGTDAANKAYVDEKSKTAEKLATPRTINVSNNAIGTATSFDGSKNINIPITGFYNPGLLWARKDGDTAGSITPLGAALVPNFNANRLAYFPDECIQAEYSNDGGTKWTDCTRPDSNKILTSTFSTDKNSYSIGDKRKSGSKATVNDKLRITIIAKENVLYCNIRKIFLRVTTEGASGATVLIEGSNLNTPDSFAAIKTTNISGWSGWNEINTVLIFGGYGNSANSQYRKLRFTFSIANINENYTSALSLLGIYIMGENCWNYPSELANKGHLYAINSDQSCTFPNSVGIDASKGSFVGNLSGTATNATNDGNGNNIASTYLKKEDTPITVSDTEPTNPNVSIWIDIS